MESDHGWDHNCQTSAEGEAGQSSLETLPIELAWIIFDKVPESVFPVRLTSRALKKYADEYAIQHTSIPVIESMTYSFEKFSFEVQKAHSNFFGLGLLLRDPSIPSKIVCNKGNQELEYTLSLSEGDDDVFQIINENMGISIRNMSIHYGNIDDEFSNLFKIVRGIQIEVLNFRIAESSKLTENACTTLLKLIKDHKVVDLEIPNVFEVTAADPVEILLQLSSNLRSISISQCFVEKGETYFFGMENFDWSQIFIEMLSRKCIKLEIMNYHTAEYLSRSGLDLLRERLPKLGKNIVFETSCNFDDEIDYEENGHRVHVWNNGLSQFLRINST